MNMSVDRPCGGDEPLAGDDRRAGADHDIDIVDHVGVSRPADAADAAGADADGHLADGSGCIDDDDVGDHHVAGVADRRRLQQQPVACRLRQTRQGTRCLVAARRTRSRSRGPCHRAALGRRPSVRGSRRSRRAGSRRGADGREARLRSWWLCSNWPCECRSSLTIEPRGSPAASARASAASLAPGASSGPSTRPANPIATRDPAIGTSGASVGTFGLEAQRRTGGDRQPHPVGRGTIERQARVDLEEVEVRRDADRHIRRVRGDEVDEPDRRSDRLTGSGDDGAGCVGTQAAAAERVAHHDHARAVIEHRLDPDLANDVGHSRQHIIDRQHGWPPPRRIPSTGRRRALLRTPCRRSVQSPPVRSNADRGHAGNVPVPPQ